MLILVLIRQDDFVLFDGFIDFLKELERKITSRIHATQVSCKIRAGHAILRLNIRVVKFRVQHNNTVGQHKQ